MPRDASLPPRGRRASGGGAAAARALSAGRGPAAADLHAFGLERDTHGSSVRPTAVPRSASIGPPAGRSGPSAAAAAAARPPAAGGHTVPGASAAGASAARPPAGPAGPAGSSSPAGVVQNASVSAAALQDHLLRRLTLNLTPATTFKKDLSRRPPITHDYQMTLAERQGLVKQPQRALSQQEWEAVERRAAERGREDVECPICREEFDDREQILLSCSHVFHKSCLAAFERHARIKSCPMCRKESYQKRVIQDGAEHFRERCTIKLQAVVRGFLARRRYARATKGVVPADVRARKKWAAQQLGLLSDDLLRAVHDEGRAVDWLLSDIDASVARARAVFAASEAAAVDWDAVSRRASERGCEDCPICLQAMAGPAAEPEPEPEPEPGAKEAPGRGRGARGGGRPRGRPGRQSKKPPRARARTILSCSHVFHTACIESLESFAVGDESPTCPVCRSAYIKRGYEGP
eukprot:tig00020616_g12275.t1